MVEIKEMYAPVVRGGARSGVKRVAFLGVTIHNTGNRARGAGAVAHGAYLQGGGAKVQASWHYAVDDQWIVQSIPEEEKAWHAADGAYGTGNSQTVAIEICQNPDSDIRAATDQAAVLTADILRRHGVTDVRRHVYQHHHWSGKNCPAQIRAGIPYNWETFLRKVEQCMEEKKTVHWAEEYLDRLVEKGLIDTPEAHRDHLDEPMPRGQIFALLCRLMEK